MAKQLLRSVLDINGVPSPENLRVNFRRLSESGFEWKDPSDAAIYKFILGYFQHHLDCPSLRVVLDYFEEKNDIEVVERLKDIEVAEVYERSPFLHTLTKLLESQNIVKASTVLKDAGDIITKGMTFGQGKKATRKQGIRDAIAYLTDELHPLVLEDSVAKTKGDLRQDTKAGWEEYQYAKLNKDKAYGCFTGLDAIDRVCHGHKKGNLWLHAAFTGELKSTFALNWGYNLVTRYRSNVLYVSVEMPYPQIRRQLYTLHTANKRWKLQGLDPLEYNKVRDGDLSSNEEAFYKVALEDFETNPEYCAFETWCPEKDVTIADIRTYAEIYHKRREIGLLIIDHGGLIEPDRRNFSSEFTIRLNSVLRDSKKLALQFNHGEGLPVLMLFQLNRNGKTEADKNEGRYKMNAISHANEAERSSDVITTTYLNDEHRTNGTTMFCNLKNRDDSLFKPFMARVDFKCRYIGNAEIQNDDGLSVVEDMEDSI
jgi:replicative DNA helicase